VSATLPTEMVALAHVTSLLINNVRLSGTLPHMSPSRRSNSQTPLYEQLQTLAITRNYLCGSTDVLGSSSKLQTLMLSSNYFSGNAVALDDAKSLANGNKLVQTCIF